MIEVQALTKQYGEHIAVDEISFTAQTGEIVGLLGPNGAGKTTTMRILTGFMPPTSGKVSIAGFSVEEDSLEIRKRVGYMPERVPVYPDMTVREYVTFWARLREVKNTRQAVDQVLQRFYLMDRQNQLVRSLSKGLRQRLGLAQTLVHNPEVVILDEPTIGIDPRQVIEVRDAVRSLAQTHTVLFSTHILSEAEQVCDRVIILNKGRIVAQGKPDELRQQLQQGDHLYIQTNGTAEQIRPIIQNTAGVSSVEPMGEGFAVRGKDIRNALSHNLTGAGFTIYELRPVAMTLEDIFLDIIGRSS